MYSELTQYMRARGVSDTEKLIHVEREIHDLRVKLGKAYALRRHLESLNPTEISAEAVQRVTREFPTASLTYSASKRYLKLSLSDTPISFHTGIYRDESLEDNIFYVTLPVYSFDIVFLPDGNIKISAGKSTTGHPHAVGTGDSFTTICAGNNDFRETYHDFVNNGFADPRELLRSVYQACCWASRANIDDMYDTVLYEPKINAPLDEIALTTKRHTFSKWFYNNRRYFPGLFRRDCVKKAVLRDIELFEGGYEADDSDVDVDKLKSIIEKNRE